MKLYNVDHSPYSTRVRIQIRKKNLAISIENPPVTMRTPEFLERFPMGKVPVLELDDGTALPESWVIMEYLEDLFPEPPLRPSDAIEKAQGQLLARYADTHLSPAGLFPLFKRLMVPNGMKGAETEIEGFYAEMARLERLLKDLPDFKQRDINIGDIALVPSLSYATFVLPLFGEKDIFEHYPTVAAWWQWVLSDEIVKSTDQEMRDAYKTFMASLSQ